MHQVIVFVLCITLLLATPLKESRFVPFKNVTHPRIINGDKAAPGQFPWQVAIYVAQPGTTNLCGGALISNSWVLTAGHCVQDATNFRILIGSNQLTGNDPNRVVLQTDQYIQHEDYSMFTLANDVAVIPLPEPVTFNGNVQAIDLSSNGLQTGTTVTVSGWGLTSDGSTSASNDLNYVSLVTVSTSDCSAAYGSSINDGVVCAKGQGGTVQSTCEGDSGGPLVINNVHVGIVSFGHSDGCESGNPVGFSDTSYFRDWIRDKTGV